MQQLLFGDGRPAFDAHFSAAQRRRLSPSAWIEHAPGWLAGHQTLFQQLLMVTDWRQQRRQMYDREVEVPRLVAKAPDQEPGVKVLCDASRVLSSRYGLHLNSVSLAFYRCGADSVAPHGDKMGPLRQNTVIAIVSVGEPRRFTFRAVDGSFRTSFALGWGDLFVMGGSCQETFLHGVPKVKHAGPRMSIQFRQTLPEGFAKGFLTDSTKSRPVRFGQVAPLCDGSRSVRGRSRSQR